MVIYNVVISLTFLVIFSPSVVHCVELTQTDSMVLSPGQVLTLSCKISGYSVTDSSYCTHFIRQPAGQTFIWMGVIWYDASKTVYAKSVEGRIEITRDNSNSMVYLKLSGLTTEDTAVYYCARNTQ
uniref:Ig-like domain-containing protein n=1 Tax=Sinocyclocheilus rhinocerous TaxID=307959 RepID=A0A673H867_9TELE